MMNTDPVTSVNNDFHQGRTIFQLFDGLAVKDLNVEVQPDGPTAN